MRPDVRATDQTTRQEEEKTTAASIVRIICCMCADFRDDIGSDENCVLFHKGRSPISIISCVKRKQLFKQDANGVVWHGSTFQPANAGSSGTRKMSGLNLETQKNNILEVQVLNFRSR